MATYPVLPQSPDSTWEPQSGIKTVIAADGSVHGRRFFTAVTYSGTIRHPAINAADRQRLETFFDNNIGAFVDFVFDGDVEPRPIYSVLVINRPTFVWVTTGRWDAIVALTGRRA